MSVSTSPAASSTGSALVAIPVPGTDRRIMAVTVDGTPMVALRHACEALGLAFSAQLQKLKARSWAGVSMIDTPSVSGVQQTAMVDRRTFTMWLATIETRRVAAEARPVIEAFQAQAADALDAYFNGAPSSARSVNADAGDGVPTTDRTAAQPAPTGDDRLDRITRQAKARAEVLRELADLVDPTYLQSEAHRVLDQALGEIRGADPANTPLLVRDYLTQRGLPVDAVELLEPQLDRLIADLVPSRDPRGPILRKRHLHRTGPFVPTAYAETDRPLFDLAWDHIHAPHRTVYVDTSTAGSADGAHRPFRSRPR